MALTYLLTYLASWGHIGEEVFWRDVDRNGLFLRNQCGFVGPVLAEVVSDAGKSGLGAEGRGKGFIAPEIDNVFFGMGANPLQFQCAGLIVPVENHFADPSIFKEAGGGAVQDDPALLLDRKRCSPGPESLPWGQLTPHNPPIPIAGISVRFPVCLHYPLSTKGVSMGSVRTPRGVECSVNR